MSKWSKPYLTDKELEDIINNFSESEDDAEISDFDDDLEDTANNFIDTALENNSDIDIDSLPIIFMDNMENDDIIIDAATDSGSSNNNCEIPENEDPISTSSKMQINTGKRRNKLIWKTGELHVKDQLAFCGNTELSQEIMKIDTPFGFFKYFFDDEIMRHIIQQSNLYSFQTNPNSSYILTEEDFRRYLGVCLFMSIVHVPNTRAYWSEKLLLNVREIISQKKFEKVRQILHFNDNSKYDTNDPNKDKLFKIRPLIKHLNQRFSIVAYEQCLSVDEQICATKARHHLKQYMPMKPHKWGFKFFVMSGSSGFVYALEMYAGSEKQQNNNDLGVTANVVLRLCQNVPKHKNYKVYFDNYYTSIPLMTELSSHGIQSIGTVRRNRIPDCKQPSEADMKKSERGASVQYITRTDETDIACVTWKDNKVVNVLSTFCDKEPTHQVKRYDRKTKQNIMVNCPDIIKQYNKHMGGVDLIDSHIGRYKIMMRSKKWYMRIFYHLLDISVINAWLLYKRVNSGNGKLLKLYEFRAEVAECLSKVQITGPKRGRPSSGIEDQLQIKKHRGPAAVVPPKDVRCDEVGHWPNFSDKRQRCKMPNCKGFSTIICEKCRVNLCFNKSANCFKNFHC